MLYVNCLVLSFLLTIDQLLSVPLIEESLEIIEVFKDVPELTLKYSGLPSEPEGMNYILFGSSLIAVALLSIIASYILSR